MNVAEKDNYRESDIRQTLIHREPIAVQHQPGPGQDCCGVVRYSHQSYHLSTGGKQKSESVVCAAVTADTSHHGALGKHLKRLTHVSVNCN